MEKEEEESVTEGRSQSQWSPNLKKKKKCRPPRLSTTTTSLPPLQIPLGSFPLSIGNCLRSLLLLYLCLSILVKRIVDQMGQLINDVD